MTTEPTPDLAAAVDRLSGLVQDLSARLDVTQAMQKDLQDTMDHQTTQKRINVWLGLVTLAVILTIGAVIVALVRIDNNADRISEVQDRTSNTVLCPLYALLVAQIEAAPSNAADTDQDGTVTGDEQAVWDNTVRVIRDGYAALNCHTP